VRTRTLPVAHGALGDRRPLQFVESQGRPEVIEWGLRFGSWRGCRAFAQETLCLVDIERDGHVVEVVSGGVGRELRFCER